MVLQADSSVELRDANSSCEWRVHFGGASLPDFFSDQTSQRLASCRIMIPSNLSDRKETSVGHGTVLIIFC